MKATLFASSILIAFAGAGFAKPKYPPELPDAREMVYKTVGETKLKLWIFDPEGHKKSDKGTAVIFFGGGWRSGKPSIDTFMKKQSR